MKTLVLIMLTLSGLCASAAGAGNEIPYEKSDIRYPTKHHCFDCRELMIKKFRCGNQDYAIHYLTGGGWGGHTTLESVCEWEHRNSEKDCAADSAPETVACYNKVVDHFKIDRLKSKMPNASGNGPTPEASR